MNKDIAWNIVIGIVSAVFIGGGAYVMMTGGLLNKADGNAGVATMEVSPAVEIDTTTSEKNGDDKLAKIKQNLQAEANNNKTMIQDGVTIEIKKEGEGAAITTGQTAVVHYTGMFPDGKIFDSSITRGETFPVQLGRNMVIAGWEKGIVGMKKGELRRLTIPPELGYGTQGAGGIIPPNATLVFDVELIEIR